jgi:hypothetical protein
MRMRYPTVAVMVALGLTPGCGDGPVGVQSPPVEDPPAASNTAPDFSAIRDLLDDPLVHELLALHGDQVAARMANEVISALAAPPNTIQITTIQAALIRLQERLIPPESEGKPELPSAVLGLVVAEAEAALATL